MASLSLKEEGNAHYRSGRYLEAEDCYTRALAEPDSPKEVLYLNRSAARLGLLNWLGAEQDANESLQLAEQAGSPGSWKAYLRRGIGHRQQAYSAEPDLLKALQLAPAAMKRRVAAELSLNYAMKQMGLNEVAREYGRPNGRVSHIGHPDHSENFLSGFSLPYGPPLNMIRVKMYQHNAAGPDMDCILGPSANPDPSVWLSEKD